MQQLKQIWGPESHQLLKTTLLKILENAILATKMAYFPPFSSILTFDQPKMDKKSKFSKSPHNVF